MVMQSTLSLQSLSPGVFTITHSLLLHSQWKHSLFMTHSLFPFPATSTHTPFEQTLCFGAVVVVVVVVVVVEVVVVEVVNVVVVPPTAAWMVVDGGPTGIGATSPTHPLRSRAARSARPAFFTVLLLGGRRYLYRGFDILVDG